MTLVDRGDQHSELIRLAPRQIRRDAALPADDAQPTDDLDVRGTEHPDGVASDLKGAFGRTFHSHESGCFTDRERTSPASRPPPVGANDHHGAGHEHRNERNDEHSGHHARHVIASPCGLPRDRLGDGNEIRYVPGGTLRGGADVHLAVGIALDSEQLTTEILQSPQRPRSHCHAAPSPALAVDNGPHQRDAGALAGKPPDHLRPSARLAEGALDQVWCGGCAASARRGSADAPRGSGSPR